MKKIAYLLPVVCLAMLSVIAKADTLKFVSNPSGTVIGPYDMTLTTSAGTTSLSLFCMNDLREIDGGESWTVNVTNGSVYAGSASGTMGFQLEEEAYLYSLYNGSNAAEVQDALWTVFDPTSSYATTASNSLFTAALGFANGSDGSTAALLARTEFYIYPDGGTINGQYGTSLPQNFIGSSPVPEPSSLILLGSGLIGLAGAARRKLARA